MKTNLFFSESIIATLLIVLLLSFLNPFDLLMTPPFLSMLSIILIAIFGLFVAVVWKEQVRDEREGLHRMLAGRLAFLVGNPALLLLFWGVRFFLAVIVTYTTVVNPSAYLAVIGSSAP